jgi:hypothetical protein
LSRFGRARISLVVLRCIGSCYGAGIDVYRPFLVSWVHAVQCRRPSGSAVEAGTKFRLNTGPPVVVGEKPTGAALADQRLKGIQREF